MARFDYVPFDDRPFRLRMGLRPLDLLEWLEVDERRDAELAMKAELVATRYDDVVAMVDRPEVDAAADELWSLVAAETGEPVGAGAHPIVRCGLATQEDWCLLVPLDGGLTLAAGCVCFPTRWVLPSKIGLPIGQVHQHVALYPEQLERPVDTFFERLTVDRPVWRLNWNVMDNAELFQPVHLGPPGGVAITAESAGDHLWLRVERQTLRRLPRTGAVAFGIRIHQRPLAALAGEPGVAELLRAAVAALPQETIAYKNLGAFTDELDAWLSQHS